MVGGAVERLAFSGMGGIEGMHRRVPEISGENCSDLPLPKTESILPPRQQAYIGSCGDFDDSMPTSVGKGKWPGPVTRNK